MIYHNSLLKKPSWQVTIPLQFSLIKPSWQDNFPRPFFLKKLSWKVTIYPSFGVNFVYFTTVKKLSYPGYHDGQKTVVEKDTTTVKNGRGILFFNYCNKDLQVESLQIELEKFWLPLDPPPLVNTTLFSPRTHTFSPLTLQKTPFSSLFMAKRGYSLQIRCLHRWRCT